MLIESGPGICEIENKKLRRGVPLQDPVTIRLMIMVLVTIMTMKTPMMMGINQTLLMLSQH